MREFFYDFISRLETQNLIAFIALVLAYLAYRKTLIDEYKSWIDLIESLRHELNYAKDWIGGCYKGDILKEWEDPSKIVYPLTSESAKALIWKGHPPKDMFPGVFFDKLTIFNERIQAFNHILFIQGFNFITNPSGKKGKNCAKHINNILHNHLIGSDGEFHLHNLYNYLVIETRVISEIGLNKVAWYIKSPGIIITISTLFYLLVDYLLI